MCKYLNECVCLYVCVRLCVRAHVTVACGTSTTLIDVYVCICVYACFCFACSPSVCVYMRLVHGSLQSPLSGSVENMKGGRQALEAEQGCFVRK